MARKKTDLTDSNKETKASGELSPELSPVYEQLKNGVDIQPLDDIAESEFVEFEDNFVSASEIDEELNDDSVRDTVKKKKNHRLLKFAVVAALLVVFAVGGYHAFFHLDDFTHGACAVYQKGTVTEVLLDNGKKIELEGAAKAALSKDGKKLIYSQDTSSKTGKYDIRAIDFSKRSSVTSKGSVIVSGIDSEWSASSDGAYVYYSETADKTVKYYAYDIAAKKSVTISSNPSEVFTQPVGDIVYFTREKQNGVSMLYRVRLGETPVLVSEATAVRAFSDSEKLEIFYTVGENTSSQEESDIKKDVSYSLYRVTGNEESELICENVSEVYLDDYVTGGNLYYFVKSSAKVNWTDFVTDEYCDADAVAQKPDKGDYLVTKGFFFKRTVLDETAYNNALKDYSQKQLRDSVREELDNIDLGLSVSSEYTVKVFDGVSSKVLAGGVKLENIYGFAETGAPRIIYSKTSIDSSEKLQMKKLSEIAQQSSAADAADYLISQIENDVGTSTGSYLAIFDGNAVSEISFNPDYSVRDASFVFGKRNEIFSLIKDGGTHYKLLYTSFNADSVNEGIKIGDNITSYELIGEKLLFRVDSKSSTSDLYITGEGGKSLLVCENAAEYFMLSDGTVISLKAIEENGILSGVDIYSFDGEKSTLIDTNASFKYFAVSDNSFAYIKNYTNAPASDSQAEKGGEMKIRTSSETKSVDTGVTDILTIKY